MSLSTLKSDLLALESAISSKSVKDILSAGAAVLEDAGELYGLFAASPETEADKTACSECVDRIHAQVNAAQVAGGIFPGDGSFLKAIAQLLITLLPLILNE